MQIEITPEYLASQGLSPTFPQRFWAKVRKTETCWLWAGATNTFGYGKIWTSAKLRTLIDTHRASWIIHRGTIPDGLCVLHNCPGGDNPACINPDHLFLGTHLDNSNDKIKKGRQSYCYGDYRRCCKFSDIQVAEMRMIHATSNIPMAHIAKKFGVSPAHISGILSGNSRVHINR